MHASYRRHKLEDVIDDYFGPEGTTEGPSGGETDAAGTEDEKGETDNGGRKTRISASRLNAAMLAGLGPRSRKRTMSRLRAEGGASSPSVINSKKPGSHCLENSTACAIAILHCLTDPNI